MNKQKLKNLKLQSSIHTFSVRSATEPTIRSHISDRIVRASYMEKTKSWIIRVNPNKFKDGDIFVYSQFMALVNDLFNDMNIPDFRFWRTDIRLDSYEDNFKECYKLNVLLISLLSLDFSDTNGQPISHMLTCTKEFSDISTRNQYWEVKYYNKKFQTNDTDPAKARLEFRSLKATQDVNYAPHIVKDKWFKKLDTLANRYEELQKQCNELLYGAYEEYCLFNRSTDCSRDMLTKFFSVYSNTLTVFSRKQLIRFFEICGVDKNTIEDRVNYVCSKTNIEFISKNELISYIDIIKKSMDDFFIC